MRFLNILDPKSNHFASISLNFAYEMYEGLTISDDLKSDLKKRFYSEKDFEISVFELKEILSHLDKKVNDLLKHPDFNPFKEDLRKHFPEQYNSQPIKYKGNTYYLHSKTFQIDSLIERSINYKKLIEDHISVSRPLKYTCK